MRSRFTELCTYLKNQISVLKIKLEQIDSAVESGQASPGGMNVTEQGLHILDFKYRGVIWLERLPEKTYMYLILFIETWLSSNDDVRQKSRMIEPPSYDIVPLGAGLVNVEVTINFTDPFYIVENENGPLELWGKKYAPGDFDLWVAESATVEHEAT